MLSLINNYDQIDDNLIPLNNDNSTEDHIRINTFILNFH